MSRCALAAAATLAASATAAAADYPTKKAPPPAPAPVVVASVTPGFFVKAGFLYGINQTSVEAVLGTHRRQLAAHAASSSWASARRSATSPTLGFEAGYFVTPNVSIDVSAGVPMWATDKTEGSDGSAGSADTSLP